MNRLASLFSLLVFALVVSCSTDEAANVELRIVSDLVPYYEAANVTAVLYDGNITSEDRDGRGTAERAIVVGAPLLRGISFARFESLPLGTYTAWVTLSRSNGEFVGRQPMVFTLAEDTTFTVRITADCAGVACPGSGNAGFIACLAGQCVDPRCAPETPEYCPADVSLFCEQASDCEPLLACGVGSCESGVCLQAPSDEECADDEFCSPISGCTKQERPEDAPEDMSGPCGDACALVDAPCRYGFIVCSEDASGCEAFGPREVGAPCPNEGTCNAEGECVAGTRGDGGVGDAGVDASDDASDLSVADDMSIDTEWNDAEALDDLGADMSPTPCPSGYFGTVATGCYDIDECRYNVCDRLTTCTNTEGSFSCSPCPDGYAGTGESGCARENGCDEEPCDPLTVCNSTGVGTFECSACPSGYIGSGVSGCFNIDECLYNVCDRLTTCTDTEGSFACSACPAGYAGDGATGCRDIDECDAAPCTGGTRCVNAVGRYACAPCPVGTASDGSAAACADLDECALDLDTCTSAQRCENRDGSYVCVPTTTLALGNMHSCAVRDGRVSCWGYSGGGFPIEGLLGYGDGLNRVQPGPFLSFGSGVEILSVSAGQLFTCAVARDGAVFCWGENGSGQLGLGDRAVRSTPTRVPGLSNVASVSAGASHACALHRDGRISCWGANWAGQLGYGDRVDRIEAAGEYVDLGGRTAVSVAAGGYGTTCAGLDDGSVRCWGYELPIEGSTLELPTPIALGADRSARKVVVGDAHACVLLDDDSVKCWGDNSYGQLGYGGNTSRPRLSSATVNLGPRRVVKDLAAAGSHSCALLDDDTVKCWGANASGQLGDGTIEARDLPGDPLSFGGRRAFSIFAGTSHSCAVLEDGAVFCWGSNDLGAVGAGLTAAVLAPPAAAIPVGGAIVDATAGTLATCAVLAGGTVKCWGANGRGDLTYGGQLGYGDAVDSDSPRAEGLPLDPSDVAIKVTVVRQHACALLDDGAVKCWGYNGSGQLGYGDTRNRPAPPSDPDTTDDTVLPSWEGLGYAVDIGTGSSHTCALLDDGTVKCWGGNWRGQLGYGDSVQRRRPGYDVVNFGAGRTALAISVGGTHSCAILDDHQLKCWGDNEEGKLGVGDSTNRNAPPATAINLGPGRTAKFVSTGYFTTCAILDDDSLKCWGGNGQIGVSDQRAFAPPAAPLDFGVGRTVRDVAVGDYQTCALLDDGHVTCWGQNPSGQLGYGDQLWRRVITNERLDFGTASGVVGLRAGGSHMCALFDDASLRCWGANQSGQLGLGFSGTITRPTGPLIFP